MKPLRLLCDMEIDGDRFKRGEILHVDDANAARLIRRHAAVPPQDDAKKPSKPASAGKAKTNG